jgi:glycosyltransferase involved in cell wall biosynthesis
VALLHHPLALETGLAPDRRRRAEQDERAALAGARRIVVTSTTTAAQLGEHYDVPMERIVVAVPGTDPRPPAPGGGDPPLLLAVGAVVPRKDYRTLIAALGTSIALPWRLRIVGNLTRAPDHVAELQAQLRAERLADRVQLLGELDDRAMEDVWNSADLFVSASRHEGFGMAVAEALARGLPVVATEAGALAEWLPATAALRVPPGDGIALGAALRRVLAEPDLRRSLREGAMAFRHELPRWESSAEAVEAALRAA